MALEIDIKQNGSFAESALEAAKALDYVADKEEQVNAFAEKIGDSYARAAKEAQALSKSAAIEAPKEQGAKQDKASGAALSMKTKELAVTKKAGAEEKKKQITIDKELKLAKDFTTAVLGSVTAAAALGAAIAFAAKGAFDAKKEAAAMVNAFTGGRGERVMSDLDRLAVNLGESMATVRSEFVEFRQAGADVKLSGELIKLRADLVAVTGSAEAADKQIDYVKQGLDGMTNIQALIRMKQVQKAFGGIGNGAKAAAFNTESLAGAQNKISNAVSEKLAALWKEIGPSIGKATHTLVDFGLKLLESEDGKKAISGLADAFKDVAAAVNSENLTTGLNVIKAIGVSIATVFETAGKAIGWVAHKTAEIFQDNGATVATAASAAGYQGVGYGKSLADGMISGMKAKAGEVRKASEDMAKDTSVPFAKELEIHSPSKLFAGYGENVVAGFQEGQARALEGKAMPIQEAAAQAVDGAPASRSMTSQSESGGSSITIQNLNVEGGGDPSEIARAVRYELQRLLQAGQLARGAV